MLMNPGFKTPSIAITELAEQKKALLVVRAKEITAVTNEGEQHQAINVVRDLKALSGEIEATRKELKEPLLALGKEIDTVSKCFVAPIEGEVSRLQNACGSFLRQKREEQERVEAEERRKREAVTAAARAEEERLRKELQEKEVSDYQRYKIEKKLDKVNANAAIELQASQQREIEAKATQTKGTQLRKRYICTVTDVKLAFAALPQIFDVTLSASKVQAALKLDEETVLKTPGLLFEEETKLSIGAR